MACSFGSDKAGGSQGLGEDDDDDDATTGTTLTGGEDGIPPGDDDDDDSGPGDTTGDDDDDDDDSSSDGRGQPECGNGIVEGDEACDDDNDIDHDGCTNACQESGSQLWGHAFGSNPAEFEVLRAVAYHSESDTYFGVGFVRPGSDFDAKRVRFNVDGDVLQDEAPAQSGDQLDGGIGVSPDGELVVVGTDANTFRVEQVTLELGVEWTDTAPEFGSGEGMAWGVAFQPDGSFLTVGAQPRTPTAAYARKYDDEGQFEGEGAIDNNLIQYFRAVSWSEASGLYYLAYNVEGNGEAVIVLDPELSQTDAIDVDTPGAPRLRDVAVTDDVVLVAGYYDEGGSYTAFVDAYALDDGSFGWRYTTTGDEGSALFLAVAVDDEGSVVAGGYQQVTLADTPGLPQRIVYKLDAETGDLRWSTIVDVEDNPIGSVQGLAIGPDNMIVAVGSAGPVGSQTGPAAYALNP